MDSEQPERRIPLVSRGPMHGEVVTGSDDADPDSSDEPARKLTTTFGYRLVRVIINLLSMCI